MMQDTSSAKDEADHAEASMSRRLSRLERQARVGILRNPNTPPRPPARRATLTGRFPSLRSSRRPAGNQLQEAADNVVSQLSEASGKAPRSAPSVTSRNGKTSIDIAGLMASVEDIGAVPPSRTPFAAAFRDPLPDAAAAKTGRRRKPSILSREAWIDDAESSEDEDALGDAFREAAMENAPDDAMPAPGRGWRLWVLTALVVVTLGALVLIAFPTASLQFLRGAP